RADEIDRAEFERIRVDSMLAGDEELHRARAADEVHTSFGAKPGWPAPILRTVDAEPAHIPGEQQGELRANLHVAAHHRVDLPVVADTRLGPRHGCVAARIDSRDAVVNPPADSPSRHVPGHRHAIEAVAQMARLMMEVERVLVSVLPPRQR